VASGAVYLTTVGNHESDWYNSASLYSNADSGGECGVMTTRLLPMPAPATTNQPWWSYEVGMIHFVGMSTEHNYDIGSEQYRWLENDLASVDRTVTPWIVFGGHRAMYINSDYGGTETSDITVMDKMILNIEPLLYKYRVNLGFYGHNHVVQRHSAVLRKQVIQAATPTVDAEGNVVHVHEDPQATVHLVIGTGGATFTKNALEPPPVWNELYFYEYGYSRLVAVNASYLTWEWVLNSNGTVLDRMVITQSDPTQAWDAEAQRLATAAAAQKMN
jgi:acid phosphatase type 7